MTWLAKNKWNSLRRQEGSILIDILAGVTLLGFIGTSFMTAFSTAYMSVELTQERVAAESLAKSQIEYIKLQDYVAVADYNPSDPANCYELIDIPLHLTGAGFSIEISEPEIVTSKGQGGFELQSVNVTVERNDQSMFKISFYKRGI